MKRVHRHAADRIGSTAKTLVPLGLALLLIAGFASAGIEGSKHDFSNAAWSKGDSCGACHTPHTTSPPKNPPLWDPQADLNRTFGTTEPQRPRVDRGDQNPKNPAGGVWTLAGRRYDPGLATLMCLRCHDGALARDFVPSVSPAQPVNTFHPGTRSAGHGRSDHPVGVAYPAVNRGYRPMNEVLSVGTIRLPGGYVECLSCHDPHNEAGAPHMLVMPNTGSALCLSCHRK